MELSIKELDQAVALRIDQAVAVRIMKKSDHPDVQEIIKTRIRLCAQTPPKVILGALDLGFEKLEKANAKIEQLEKELKVCWVISTLIFLHFLVTLYLYRLSRRLHLTTLPVKAPSIWLFRTRSTRPHLRAHSFTKSCLNTKTYVLCSQSVWTNSALHKRSYSSKRASTSVPVIPRRQIRLTHRVTRTVTTPCVRYSSPGFRNVISF